MGSLTHLTMRDTTAASPYGLLDSGDTHMFIINTVFLIFAVVCVAGRFWTQRHRAPRYLPEDALCLIALAAFIAQCGIVYNISLRAHPAYAHKTPEDWSTYFRMLFAVQFTYAIEMGAVRLSVILFELRLFGIKPWLRWACYITITLVVSWVIMTIVLALTICFPIRKTWDPKLPGYCGNLNASYEGIAGTGIVLDSMIFLTPIPVIWRLHSSLSRRILLICLYAIGLFDIICGALRLYALTQGIDYSPVLTIAWGTIEPAVAIFVASAPHYTGFYNRIAKFLDSTGFQLSSFLKYVRDPVSLKFRDRVNVKDLDSTSRSTSPSDVNYAMESRASAAS